MPSIDLKDQYYGCEIELTGITRQQAAQAIASLFGTTAHHCGSPRVYDPWEVTDRQGKVWRFVCDSSIHGSRRVGGQQLPCGDKAYKVEMNSPKLEYSEMGKLQEVVRALRHAGAVVNGSCGMHVHVDASQQMKKRAAFFTEQNRTAAKENQWNEIQELLTSNELDLTEYSDALVYRIVERVVVISKEEIRIRFTGGLEITQSL